MSSKAAVNRGIKKGLDKWAKTVQVDVQLRVLADIKTILDSYYEKGYSIDWELDEMLEEIEELTSEAPNEVNVIKIITLIKEYYESIGRNALEEYEGAKEKLFRQIKEVIDTVQVPSSYLVISRLKFGGEK